MSERTRSTTSSTTVTIVGVLRHRGGVGKTTTAAIIAIEGARRGRRAVVVTIDPAKRLANALGLDELSPTSRA